MTTPLEYAQDTLLLLKSSWPDGAPSDRKFPDTSWAQLGRPIVTCESAAVGAASSRRRALFSQGMQCGFVELSDIIIAVARDCGVEFENDGHTDPERAAKISAAFEFDTAVIEEVLNGMGNDIDDGAETTIQWLLEGAFAITVASTTVVVL